MASANPDSFPAVRLAGLVFRVEGSSSGIQLPACWTVFRAFHGFSDRSDLTLHLTPDLCPVEPGPLLNTSPHFHMYQAPRGGLLCRPVGPSGWTAWYRPDLNRLELYAGENPAQPDPAWIDSVLRRFRVFILARHDRVVFHASAAMRDGKAFVFAGDSGVGKSTLAGLLAGGGWTVLSDEAPIVSGAPGEALQVWGSPWPSSGGFANPGPGFLAGLYLLEHGSENRLTRLEPGAAVKRLLAERLALCPWYEAFACDRVLAVLERMVQERPCHVLAFKPDASVVELLCGEALSAKTP